MSDVAHTPTNCSGTVTMGAGEFTYDYTGCTVCRVDHPILGEVPQPWHKAHPGVLPATATQTLRDGTTVRR